MEYDEGTIEVEKSRSTWACELKSPVSCSMVSVVVVTLHVSVWVEMHQKDPCFETNYVTLHVSVWVEIFFFWFSKSKVMSRSTWACELKCFVQLNQEPVDWVTLHVSVWVEIFEHFGTQPKAIVTLHVSVWVEIHWPVVIIFNCGVTLHVSVWVNFRFNAGLRVYVIRSDHSKCCVVFKACSKRRLSWI